jgi:hypothetical protein
VNIKPSSCYARGVIETGTTGEYEWLETDHNIQEFVTLCAQVITGNYLVITAVDGGSFKPSCEDAAVGWTVSCEIAYSPRIESAASLPPKSYYLQFCAPDEWLIYTALSAPVGSISHGNVFSTKIEPGVVFRFANFCGFRFSDPAVKVLADLFWEQIAWLRPESYVADCDTCLLFATRNPQLYYSVLERLREPQLEGPQA